METSKAQLRYQLKQARLGLTNAEHTRLSRELVSKLIDAVDWSKVQTLHFFEPISELMEPDISGLITYIEDEFPGVLLFTPRLIEDTWQIVAVKGGTVPEQFDVVLVPMLAFDERLNRIGYGGGYYDKFLATQAKARKVGVSFELSKIPQVPVEEYDVSLDLVVTEVKTYS